MAVLKDAAKKGTKNTRNKIMYETARLFALYGYTGVSMREIAEVMEMEKGSIYNHYKGKEEILNVILDSAIKEINDYFQRVEVKNEKALDIETVVNNMFDGLCDQDEHYVYYGIAVAGREHFWSDKARELYCSQLLKKGRELAKKHLESAVERGYCPPFDTEVISAFIVSCIILGNNLRITSMDNCEEIKNINNYYKKVCDFIIEAAKAGI